MSTLLFYLCFLPATLFAQCHGVEVRKDKSTGTLEKRMPTLFKKEADAGTNLLEKKNTVKAPVALAFYDTVYSLLLAVKGRSLPYNPKGAYALLANGEQLLYPEAECLPMILHGKMLYFTSVPLSSDDLQKIRTHAVTGVRVAAFECTVAPWLGEKLKTYFNCVVQAK